MPLKERENESNGPCPDNVRNLPVFQESSSETPLVIDQGRLQEIFLDVRDFKFDAARRMTALSLSRTAVSLSRNTVEIFLPEILEPDDIQEELNLYFGEKVKEYAKLSTIKVAEIASKLRVARPDVAETLDALVSEYNDYVTTMEPVPGRPIDEDASNLSLALMHEKLMPENQIE